MLTIVNMLQRTWQNKYVSELVFFFTSDIVPEVELLDYVLVLFLYFEETPYCLNLKFYH